LDIPDHNQRAMIKKPLSEILERERERERERKREEEGRKRVRKGVKKCEVA
jgi:hypothetical protein